MNKIENQAIKEVLHEYVTCMENNCEDCEYCEGETINECTATKYQNQLPFMWTEDDILGAIYQKIRKEIRKVRKENGTQE